MRRLLFVVFLLAALAAAGLAILLATPYSGFGNPVFVDIPKGTGTLGMGRKLQDAGVVRSQWLFLAARALRPSSSLKAGEYRFDRALTPWQAMDKIARGDVFLFTLVVPEGHNMFDIADHLAASQVMSRDAFLEAARDPALIRDLAPQAPSLEGYLFPDTYKFQRKTTAQQLTKMLTDRFRKAWDQAGAPKVSVHDTVTLASLVEKEARVAEERSLVASVYANRLRIGMPLQCDPTTIYAARLEDRWRGTIYRSDLDNRNPYNTYQNAGLPPGPIANPGLEAIKAALQPAESPYLYFVAKADGTGAHNFSEALADHSRAVRQYRRAVAQAKEEQAKGPASVAGPAPAGAGGPTTPGRAQGSARTR
ncbi:MAG TPA: endolytic transglycosylase MltG [Bryobacteraceae bacterium]|nr:endolytic transglycosylase MltG [Bryobacteraceae bacterium]